MYLVGCTIWFIYEMIYKIIMILLFGWVNCTNLINYSGCVICTNLFSLKSSYLINYSTSENELYGTSKLVEPHQDHADMHQVVHATKHLHTNIKQCQDNDSFNFWIYDVREKLISSKINQLVVSKHHVIKSGRSI